LLAQPNIMMMAYSLNACFRHTDQEGAEI